MPTDTIQSLLTQELGIESLPKELQEEAISSLGELVLKRIAMLVLEALPENERETFNDLAEAGDQGKMGEFLKAKLPNLDVLIKQAVDTEVAAFKEFQKSLPVK